jgi:2-polyprenyl-3-methyl-5-hydroxy-6-metoxy-1,4-benzoquinol methylase
VTSTYLQRDQPEGVPPLALTGERTLPDVPEENYWYQRHLVVYEWIAGRVAGRRVIDMASGEGYGSAVLARAAASVVGVEANPEAFEHARLRYAGGGHGEPGSAQRVSADPPNKKDNLRFERALVEEFREDADVVVFLQTIEHLQDPDATLEHFASIVGADGSVIVSTPNVLTLAPKGAERSGNPWHVHEYRPEEFERLCRRHFQRVELHGLFHARKLRVHELALRLGWDRVHAALGLTERFYGWFTPAISARDFALRQGPASRLERALDLLAVCRP